jgi:hypothetical protein
VDDAADANDANDMEVVEPVVADEEQDAPADRSVDAAESPAPAAERAADSGSQKRMEP